MSAGGYEGGFTFIKVKVHAMMYRHEVRACNCIRSRNRCAMSRPCFAPKNEMQSPDWGRDESLETH